jgi:hypothetical protein
MFRFPHFPKEAPYGFYRIGEEYVSYQGFVHFTKVLVESSQFAEQYAESGKMDPDIIRMILFNGHQTILCPQIDSVLKSFDYRNPEIDKKPFLDFLQNTFCPLLKKMKEVIPEIEQEVDAFFLRTLQSIIAELQESCS